MPDIIQHILELPRYQQIAIIQAIMAQWQIEEPTEEEKKLLGKQIEFSKGISADVKNGTMGTISFEEYKKRALARKNKRNGL